METPKEWYDMHYFSDIFNLTKVFLVEYLLKFDNIRILFSKIEKWLLIIVSE
jgi:hypothetical protein